MSPASGNTFVKVMVDDAPLRKLIKDIEKQGNPVRFVADGVEYGVFIEFGTAKMPARAAGGNAVESLRNTVERVMSQVKSLDQMGTALDKLAYDLEKLWKQNVTSMHAVDTGAYRASIHVVSESDHEMFASISSDGKVKFAGGGR